MRSNVSALRRSTRLRLGRSCCAARDSSDEFARWRSVVRCDLVIPTIGRPSLTALLHSLAQAHGPLPHRILLIDDRRDISTPLPTDGIAPHIAERITVIRGKAAGPASARNAGWRMSTAEWIAFLDDDVLVHGDWLDCLARDIEALRDDDAGSQGRVRVPLPQDRPPTDWERNVAGLESSAWITADMV